MMLLTVVLVLGIFVLSISFKQLRQTKREHFSSVPQIGSSTCIRMADNFAAFLEKQQRPKPVGLPRKRLELPFAVLLMRSSYSIVDDLDFVPMDEFQRSFFLFRQSEWEDYKEKHSTVFQGDLADPLYFDFISFAQYATIADKIRNGKLQFVEKTGAEGDTAVVRRNPLYENNNILPIIHSQMVGDRILQYIYDTYPSNILPRNDTVFPTKTDALASFITNAQLLLDIFTFNSYALNLQIKEQIPNSSTLSTTMISSSLNRNSNTNNSSFNNNSIQYATISMQLPTTLWSQQVLKLRNDSPINHFEIKLLDAYARRNKLQVEWLSTTVKNDIDVSHLIRIS